MSKLDDLINKLCPDGVEFKKLGSFATVIRGGSFQKKDFVESGKPCIHYGQMYTHFRNTTDTVLTYLSKDVFNKSKQAEPNDIIMAVTSENVEDVCSCVAWLGKENVAVSGHTAIIHHNQNPVFLSYYFHSEHFFAQKIKLAHGTKVIEVTPSKLEDLEIPVPPLEVQNEIVRILDNFTELEEELEEELVARRKQYEYYRDSLLTFDDSVEWTTLENIADIGTGSSNTNEGLTEGLYPFYVRSPEVRRKNTYEYDETAIITSGDGVGVGKIFHYVEGKYALHQRAYRIHINTNKINPKFYYFYMKTTFYSYINKEQFKASVQSIRRPMLNKYPVPIPSIKDQERIVSIMERFEIICNDITAGLPAEIEARHKQYEYYRDKLLTFKRKGEMSV